MSDARNNLGAMQVIRKTGEERLHVGNTSTDFSLLSFWQWCCSDLLSNTLRGKFAEYIVACALGLEKEIRVEWDAIDLTFEDIRIEVKSAARLQSWEQKHLSPINFDIRSTLGWHAKTNTHATIRGRQADIYVFCVLSHEDKRTVNPLDLSQWEFYVLPTRTLAKERPNQKRMSLSTLLTFEPEKCGFNELRKTIHRAASNAPDVVI